MIEGQRRWQRLQRCRLSGPRMLRSFDARRIAAVSEKAVNQFYRSIWNRRTGFANPLAEIPLPARYRYVHRRQNPVAFTRALNKLGQRLLELSSIRLCELRVLALFCIANRNWLTLMPELR